MMPLLVAHRGYSAHMPENTLAAMQAALAAGACCIEFDVQLCADGAFAVIHDDTLLRTSGVDGSVFDMTTAELQTVSVHEPARLGEQFLPEYVPALEAMLAVIKAHPTLTAFVEIKQESLTRWGVEQVMHRLIAALHAHRQQCVIISFSDTAIACAQQYGQLRTGWVLPQYNAEQRAIAEQLQPDFLVCNQRKINTPVPWSGPWQWMLYGVETAQAALDWGRRGVAFVETDHIAELMQNKDLQRGACRHER